MGYHSRVGLSLDHNGNSIPYLLLVCYIKVAASDFGLSTSCYSILSVNETSRLSSPLNFTGSFDACRIGDLNRISRHFLTETTSPALRNMNHHTCFHLPRNRDYHWVKGKYDCLLSEGWRIGGGEVATIRIISYPLLFACHSHFPPIIYETAILYLRQSLPMRLEVVSISQFS